MINPKKFYERRKLFHDLLYEIFKVESNYRTELSILNLKLSKKVEDYRNKFKKITKQDNNRQSVQIKNDLFHSSIKSTTSNKSEDFILIEKEDSFIDTLISDGLQQLITFYKGKHKLISKEVSNLGIILYNYSSQKSNNETNNKDLNLEKNEKEFDIYYNKLTTAKEKYFDKMNEIELLFHNDGNNNINNNNVNNNSGNTNSNSNTNANANSKNVIKKTKNKVSSNKNMNKINEIDNINLINENDEDIEKEKIDELKQYRKNYKKSLDDINNTKRTYIAKINEICNQIQEFNIIENNILYNIFKTFNENLCNLLKDVDKFCTLYENNQKNIQDLNLEFSNNLIFDKKINMNYQFEEYNPKFSDIHNKKDLSVIQKMHKLIGFEFDKINHNGDDDLNNKEKDNVLFIILMEKFTAAETVLTEKEKFLLKNLFNQEKYINEFINKLNVIRINKKLFYNKEKFDLLFELFEAIFSKISFSDEKNHELVKLLMILSETFYYKNDNKKIFLNSVLKLPPELKEINFWIRYIEIEIENENIKISSNKNKKKNIKSAKFEYIVLLSNLTHLREYMGDKAKMKEIIDYFTDKYKFSLDDFDIIKSQLNI